MRSIIRVVVVMSLLAMTSCMTSFKAIEDLEVTGSLVGKPEAEIIDLLGAPSDIVDYQNGTILVYEGNEVAFVYNSKRKIANPKLEVFCSTDGRCVNTRVSQMEKVRKFSPGKTILLVLGILLLL